MRLQDAVAPGVLIAIGVIWFVLAVRRQEARWKVLAEYASRLGMTRRDGPDGPEFEGTVRGVPLRIGHVSRPAWNGGKGHRRPIRFTGRPQRPIPTVIVRDRDAPSEMLPGLAAVRLGDAAFDKAFKLYTADEAAARALLAPALIAELIGGGQRNDRAEALKIDASEVFIEYDGSSGTHHEAHRLERIVDVVTNLCAPRQT